MKKLFPLFLTLSLFLLFISCEKDSEENDIQKPVYNYIDSFNIIVFGSNQCIYCTDLEDKLKEEQLTYTYYDTGDPGNSSMMWQKLYDSGYQSNYVDLPVVEVTTDSVRLLIQPNFENDIIPLITK